MNLVEAILDGSLDDVRRAIAAGADLNEVDVYGYPPLIEAAVVSDAGKAEILLRAGADPHLSDMAGRTALHWAADNNNQALCELLLKAGADPNAASMASQPVLVMPLLREFAATRLLLTEQGASVAFARDFINAKLLAHRFELFGYVSLANHRSELQRLNLSGFFVECTLGILLQSLSSYKRHFSGRQWWVFSHYTDQMISALTNALELVRYQHYLIDHGSCQQELNILYQHTPLLLPIAYEGHAVSIVCYGRWLAKCDRGEHSKNNPTVALYRMDSPERLNAELYQQLLYEKTNAEMVHDKLLEYLGAQQIATLPVPSQLTGNCSWANLEASIPAMFFMLKMREQNRQGKHDIQTDAAEAMAFFRAWQDWDKEIALTECLSGFNEISKPRRAAKAELLSTILFQACRVDNPQDRMRAEKIAKAVVNSDVAYVLDNFVSVYVKNNRETVAGENLKAILELCDLQA